MIKKLLLQTLGGPPDNYFNQVCRRMKFLMFRARVRQAKPRRIMEIGLLRGERAEEMIRVARESGVRGIEYYGFDIFDDTFIGENEKGWAGEKVHVFSMEEADSFLSRPGVKHSLFKGDTRKTLPAAVPKLPKMDFIYIDGGHDYEVVKSDWENVRKLMHDKTVVVFDDYHLPGIRKTVNEMGAGYKVNNIPFIPGVREHVAVWKVTNGEHKSKEKRK